MKGTGSIYEILIILLLTSLIAGAGTLQLKRIKEEIELKNFSNQLRDFIYEGYLTAIREEKNQKIKIENKKMILASREGIEKHVIAIPKDINVTTREEIDFFDSGTISPASILLEKNSSNCLLKISLRGRVLVNCGVVT